MSESGRKRKVDSRSLTPGQYLAAELSRLGVTRAELATALGVRWPTTHRWISDDGFTPKNRRGAAQALGLQPDHFERPDVTAVHRVQCKAVLQAYLAGPAVPADIAEGERAALASLQVPLDRKPTELFYQTLLLIMRSLPQVESGPITAVAGCADAQPSARETERTRVGGRPRTAPIENESPVVQRIYALLNERKMSAAELARRVRISDKAIQKWRRGEAEPSLSTSRRIARVLGVPLDSLLEDDRDV